MALIAIAFDSTYVDQDDLPVVTSGTSRDSGSCLCAESSWDRVALTAIVFESWAKELRWMSVRLRIWEWKSWGEWEWSVVKVCEVSEKLKKEEDIFKGLNKVNFALWQNKGRVFSGIRQWHWCVLMQGSPPLHLSIPKLTICIIQTSLILKLICPSPPCHPPLPPSKVCNV